MDRTGVAEAMAGAGQCRGLARDRRRRGRRTFLIGTDGQRRLARGVYREGGLLRRLGHTWRWDGSDTETLVTIEKGRSMHWRTRRATSAIRTRPPRPRSAG